MLTDLVADGDERMPVALVAGATRGAGRAIAVELARAGFFVYATGRSSRATGPSEIGRPETIEETERIVKGLAAELENLPVTAVGVTPGWLRSEMMLENFGVTEASWRDACATTPGFAISESPAYVARGVAALATAGDAERWAGTIVSARQLADAYGVTDTDGSKPDCWGYLAAYGWEREDGEGVERFR